MKANNTKLIFVSGGVISGLGKGISTSSIALLLKSRGYRVTAMKFENYLNIDAGTIRPQEHGEVFVTGDGMECDQDIGNYERFLSEKVNKENFVTIGQVYKSVIDKERALAYGGEDVEAIPHITDEVIKRIKLVAKKTRAQIIVIELGGTAGEYQNALYYESNRILKSRYPQDVLHIHVSYLPKPEKLGELKSKPVQTSVRTLNSMGIQPDFILARAHETIDKPRRERISTFCNVHPDEVIAAPDVESIYEVPVNFERQNLTDQILKKLSLTSGKKDLAQWKQLVNTQKHAKKVVKIGIVGKYFGIGNSILSDVYLSVIEGVKHGALFNRAVPEISWIIADDFEKNRSEVAKQLSKFDGIIVPGGFGARGVEGKILAIEYARKNKIPYLGLCYGMQLAVIEFARNVAKMTGADTTENNRDTKFPVIDVLPEQKVNIAEKNFGATMRLGDYPCKIIKNTVTFDAYKTSKPVLERHRHRFEFNNAYRDRLEKSGLVVSGLNPQRNLVEIIELPKKVHPFFVGTQFHAEFNSSPLRPHPLFAAFIKSALKIKKPR
ncbi:MAG: CTP synthase [Patescibacteria group bacterium]